MLTALISAVLGLISGAVPKVLDEVSAGRAHKREIEFLKLQNELQLAREAANADSKMREAESNLIAEEVRATREQLSAIIETQGRPVGIPWIDGLNALLRPTVAAGIICLFFWVSIVFVSGVMQQYSTGKIDPQTLANVVWGSMVGEGIMATLGFVFGYRSMVAKR
jgi:hypothetical protein